MVTLTSCALVVKPFPVNVTSVPLVPRCGDIEERDGVIEEENVKEQFLLKQLDGMLLNVTVT